MLLQINTIACDGSDVFWPWLLWLLGAFLLGLILGWLLKQLFGGSGDNKIEDNSVELARLKADLAACELDKKKLSSSLATASSKVVSASSNVASASSGFVAAAAVAKDDLTKVEGIGPKIKEHLNNADIWSFKQLSESSIESLQKVLDDAGPRYKMHNPKTWAQQAKFAHEGKWDELKEWQDNLHGGV